MLPNFEYCCLNLSCSPSQFTAMDLSDSYHSLASPTSVKQKLWTLTPSGKVCMSIQSFVLRRCASASSSGLPENSGLKCYQFKCGMGTGCFGCEGVLAFVLEGQKVLVVQQEVVVVLMVLCLPSLLMFQDIYQVSIFYV